MQAKQCQLQPIGDAKLVIYLAQVILHDLFCSADAQGDLFILHALGDTGND